LKVHEFGIMENGSTFMVLDYLEGKSLFEWLTSVKRFTLEQSLPILTQVLDALEHAHQKDIIHRDLKPDNIMLIGTKAILIDFGISKLITDNPDKKQTTL